MRMHALGTAAEFLLLTLGKFQGFQFLVFFMYTVQKETDGAHSLDRFCYPDSFNHSHQITQLEKMVIIATRRNGKLYLLASLRNFVQSSQFLRTYMYRGLELF